MVINLRQNKNEDNAAFGKYFAEVDTKEPLNLKGLAAHMADHQKISTFEMIELVLGEMVKCMVHLMREGQPVKLDGFGTFSPSVDGQGNGMNSIEEAVAAGAENLINGIRLIFTPENTKGEQLTSRALKDECVFTFGYLVESEKRTVNGKVRRVQNKTPLSYLLAPEDDGTSGGSTGGNTGGTTGGGTDNNGGTTGGGTQSGGSDDNGGLPPDGGGGFGG